MAKPTGIWIGAVFLVLYFGAYFAILDPEDGGTKHHFDKGEMRFRSVSYRYVNYRLGHLVTETIFRPVLWLDQHLRPQYWAWEELPE